MVCYSQCYVHPLPVDVRYFSGSRSANPVQSYGMLVLIYCFNEKFFFDRRDALNHDECSITWMNNWTQKKN